jgi:hypothetical protein
MPNNDLLQLGTVKARKIPGFTLMTDAMRGETP